MIWNKTLDPNSPDYKWEEGGVVASSDGVEDCNAIDPGVFLDPTDGRLWLAYGSYFGYIRLVSLIPRPASASTRTTKPVNIAINCEASDMIITTAGITCWPRTAVAAAAPTPATTSAWAAPGK